MKVDLLRRGGIVPPALRVAAEGETDCTGRRPIKFHLKKHSQKLGVWGTEEVLGVEGGRVADEELGLQGGRSLGRRFLQGRSTQPRLQPLSCAAQSLADHPPGVLLSSAVFHFSAVLSVC